VRDLALQNRADILGALADYAATQSALQLEIARQYPDIHFGPYYQYNQGDHQFTLQVTAELPVLNQNQGPIAEAEAKRSAAAAQFLALQAKVMTQIDSAVAAYRVTRENLTALESLAAAQKKQNEAVAAQMRAGAAAQLDVLNSRLELAAGELAQLDGRVKLQQAFAALEDAAQRPLEAVNPSLIEQPPAQAMKEQKP
jgi:outer membrane protein, heavy metal efflux system